MVSYVGMLSRHVVAVINGSVILASIHIAAFALAGKCSSVFIVSLIRTCPLSAHAVGQMEELSLFKGV
jgi:hypothetical protein